MKSILLREIRLNMKNAIIWSLTVGGLGLACILLYQNMQGDMKEMADAFSNMGAFSDAFGMSTLSIATLKGYFATEVGTVHGLGGGMFAAIIAISILSKEEEGHTGEFIFSLPVSRSKVILSKALCILISIVFLTLICALLYAVGFEILDEKIPMKEFITFMGMNLLMNLEIAAMCFAVSAFSGKNRTGQGLGIALIFYVFDLIGRVVPDLKEYLFIGPYSYANASSIFSGNESEVKAIVLGVIILAISVTCAFGIFNKRDLAG